MILYIYHAIFDLAKKSRLDTIIDLDWCGSYHPSPYKIPEYANDRLSLKKFVVFSKNNQFDFNEMKYRNKI